ncbi:Protein CBR-PPW-2 [Caenorhabditis briggsae]|uniref:Protein CBR-PPW-2 n=1 Tax=Caenorhabditis briggsae TaxID=6238 RepID=A8WJ71_CAEBR|nr:Protein CBR-PPW-2 [Caenorhabditis briggsae]CAP20513.2 Protein CBR-PPW-2 [Caenorhabditis briggsae]
MPATPLPPAPMPPVTAPPGPMPPPPLPPAPGPVLPITSAHKTANDACIKRLSQIGIMESPRIYPSNQPPGTYGKEILVQSNVFGIEVENEMELFQYSVCIRADVAVKKEVVFTKKGKDDFVVLDRHEKCCTVLYHAYEAHDDFFQSAKNCLIYNGQSMLYSSMDLFSNRLDADIKSRTFQIDGVEIGHKDLLKLPCIKLEISATKNPVVKFNRQDVGKRSADQNMLAVNTAYRNILELALNQSCVQDYNRCAVFEHGKIFFIRPTEEGFISRDCVDVGDGKRMMPGIKKTVQFVEGPFGREECNPAVVIDGMKVAFHKEQPIIEKLQEVVTSDFSKGLKELDRERCAGVIKGLDCYSNYMGRLRHLKIEGIHHESASKARFQVKDGNSSTVADYFQSRWNITLKYPEVNLICCKEKGNVNFYPMELMFISPNQRVKISQLTSAQSQRTTKESAVPPDVRQRLIMTGKTAAKISGDSAVLNKLGVQICEAPLLVRARQFPPVKIALNPTSSVIPQKEGKWRIGQYSRPAAAPKVWAMYAVGTPSSRFSQSQLTKFAREFVTVAQQKGIQLNPPSDSQCVLATDIESQLAAAHKASCEFVFIITDDTITNLHQKYKMIESLQSIVVQDMKMSKALSVIDSGKRLTLENVINKTNVKLGGSNYIFTDTKKYLDRVLVIGIGISQPPPGTKFIVEGKGFLNPQIIGFAYNGKQKQEFAGDFVLCPAGQDVSGFSASKIVISFQTLSPIEDIMKESILGYKKWHDGNDPETVVVYRSGISEGNHGNVLAYEIPLARAGINEVSKSVKLVYLAVSKDHTYRFFRNNLDAIGKSSSSGTQVSASASRTSVLIPKKKSFQSSQSQLKPCDINIPSGISIDQMVTNPAIKQFFLNSHTTLQGSAKTPLYSILADDTRASLESLEELTYNLCHLHQIVGLPTSIPTPLYVAAEYAKRGRNLWNEANLKNPLVRSGSEREQLRAATHSINYKHTGDFSDRRVNA